MNIVQKLSFFPNALFGYLSAKGWTDHVGDLKISIILRTIKKRPFHIQCQDDQ